MFENELKNIVIVAGGENTRFNEMSIFPKILLPTLEYPSILSLDCDLFKDYNIYLVMNEKYADMTRQYINKNKLNVKLVISHNHNGSANTIKELRDELPEENLLFIWSDLILDNKGLTSIKKAIDKLNYINSYNIGHGFISNIIFTNGTNYRYNVDTNGVIEEIVNYTGNVPGIYYCSYFDGVFNNKNIEFTDNLDLIQIFQKYLYNDYVVSNYDSEIVEFRDLRTYLNYYSRKDNTKTPTRFFNQITIEDNKLTKKCINSSYNNLIDREIDWYNKCKLLDFDNVPKVYYTDKKNHIISMEYLDGYMNIYQFIKSSTEEEFNEFMSIYIDTVNEMHGLDSIERDKCGAIEDYHKEFFKKVIDRCDNISGILYKYNKCELEDVLNKAFKEIQNKSILADEHIKYVFGHGDLNGSNVMYNPKTKDIKFIDPRGYFGNSDMYIPAEYDLAKIMYCLSGYDDFNNGNSIFTTDYYDEPKALREINFGDNHDLYEIMVAIIWICLAEYISQDVFKANIAYAHGLNMLKTKLGLNKEKKIIISDCDGILTNGKSIYTSDGKIAKVYGAYDTEAIETAHNAGWEILFVSNDQNGWDITQRRLDEYKVKGWCDYRIANKKQRQELVNKYKDLGYTVIFVGDSISDIPSGKDADKFCTTANALYDVRYESDFVSNNNGGEGGFAEIIYEILNEEEL